MGHAAINFIIKKKLAHTPTHPHSLTHPLTHTHPHIHTPTHTHNPPPHTHTPTHTILGRMFTWYANIQCFMPYKAHRVLPLFNITDQIKTCAPSLFSIIVMILDLAGGG